MHTILESQTHAQNHDFINWMIFVGMFFAIFIIVAFIYHVFKCHLFNKKRKKQGKTYFLRFSSVIQKAAIGLINPGRQVPLTLEFDKSKVIGWGHVLPKGYGLLANMTIKDPLNIEQLTPTIGGKVLEMDENGNILKFELTEISLCSNQNIANSRIKAL